MDNKNYPRCVQCNQRIGRDKPYINLIEMGKTIILCVVCFVHRAGH